jgi:hypothetical protein
VARVQNTDKFVDQPLGCFSRGVSVNNATRTVTTFSVPRLAFNTVIQAFLTTFLVDSGYETPIQNMDELFASDIKLAYPPHYSFIFEDGDETEASHVRRKLAKCPSFFICENWAIYQRNVSLLLIDLDAELSYFTGDFLGENSEPLLCSLKDGVVLHSGQVFLMLKRDQLLRRVNEIIGRVVEAGIYNYWLSKGIHFLKFNYKKIAIVQLFDEYYSFKLYHIQPAFYLLFIGWGLSVLCFNVELFYNRVLRKK